MTQLERELQRELQLQRDLFKSELESVTATYESNLKSISTQYQQIINDQKSIIDQQSETLQRYENVTSDIKVSLDQEQLNSLKQLNERLVALERSDSDLVEQLNAVLAKL